MVIIKVYHSEPVRVVVLTGEHLCIHVGHSGAIMIVNNRTDEIVAVYPSNTTAIISNHREVEFT